MAEPVTATAGGTAGTAAGVAGAVAAITAPVLGSIINAAAQSRMAKRAMAFSERMSNTAHQREMNDLRKANLNPILSMGGTGASSPQGVMSDVGDPGRDVSQAIIALSQLALAKKQAASEISVNEKRKQQISQDVATSKSQENVNSAMTSKIEADKLKTLQDVQVGIKTAENIASQTDINSALKSKVKAEEKLIRENTAGASYENVGRKAESTIYKGPKGGYIKAAEKLIPSVGVIGNLISKFRKSKNVIQFIRGRR